MFKKTLLTICLLLLTTVSSSEADFTPRAIRPDLTNVFAPAVSNRSLPEKEAKIIKEAGETCHTLSLLAANDNIASNDLPASELADRTASSQIIADMIKNFQSLEQSLGKLAKAETLDNIYVYEEAAKFTDKAGLMKKQVEAAKKWLIEYRLFAGSDLSRQNRETLNQLYLRRGDNDADVYSSWQKCLARYADVFNELNKFFIPVAPST